MNKDRILSSLKHEEEFEYQKWIDEIPFLNFPSYWKVKIIPPFGGAIVRFRVRTNLMPCNEFVSVYLDCYNLLGFSTGPYWEVYPGNKGDNQRVAISNDQELLVAIQNGINHILNRQ